MTFALDDREWGAIATVPTHDLVELAADLDIIIPGELDRRALADLCVPRMVARARAQGVPLSTYDSEDLEALPADELRTLAALQGSAPTVSDVLRAGEAVYRKTPPRDAFALLVPSLLRAMLRCAAEEGSGSPPP